MYIYTHILVEPEFRELFQIISNYFKLFPKSALASNADSGLPVALSAPRSAFPADFQPAEASRRPTGGTFEKAERNTPM